MNPRSKIENRKPPIALTIATSDSGGGAGIQADLKSMQANGVYGASVLVASTAQNTHAVTDVHAFPTAHIEAQCDAVASDLAVGATKTGMLFSEEIVRTVARKVEEHDLFPLVVDPVMISKSGDTLLQDDAVAAVREALLPLATLVTPNSHEAARLAGREKLRTEADAREAARTLHARGPEHVLVKGGHLDDESEAVDVLFSGGTEMDTLRAERLDTPHTHGTGCTYASAIAAGLARGIALGEAVRRAKRYVTDAIRHGFALSDAPAEGSHGPTHHFYFLSETEPFPAEESRPA
jgi:hydroxymethylpyrimidine/phosphomethylpyrimidine kinase